MIRILNRIEDRYSIREVTRWANRAKLDKFAECKQGVVESKFDDLRVDLFEILYASAFGEESKTGVVLE